VNDNRTKEDIFLDFLNGVKPLIIRIATIYCHEETERHDLIQDIILQMWRSFERYDDSYAATTWTYRVALNVSISWVRKETSRKKHLTIYEHQFIDWHDHQVEDPRISQLLRFIEGLNSIDKAIMTLLLDGCRNKEIATIMGISASNVSTRINRVKKQLLDHFNI